MNYRVELEKRFGGRLSVDPKLGRQVVSYQGNRGLPGLRWMKYKEGFSKALVERFLEERSPRDLLDPFSGLGTTPLVASGQGVNATGIEIMPEEGRVIASFPPCRHYGKGVPRENRTGHRQGQGVY